MEEAVHRGLSAVSLPQLRTPDAMRYRWERWNILGGERQKL
jgi:hypothetical protein